MVPWLMLLMMLVNRVEGATVTYPANPNYYRYAPDENQPYRPLSREDKKLEERIRKKLKGWLASGYEGQIKIDVNNGNVTLNGFVGSAWDKDDIEQKVRSVTGVRFINNQITIQNSYIY